MERYVVQCGDIGGRALRVCISCAFAGSSGRPFPDIVDCREVLAHSAFEASTHDWAADEKLVSGEDAEMIPAEEFFKDGE